MSGKNGKSAGADARARARPPRLPERVGGKAPITLKFGSMLNSMSTDTADKYQWSRAVAQKLFGEPEEPLTDEFLKTITLPQLVMHAAMFNACTPKGGRFFAELLNRSEGKVPDKVQIEDENRPTMVIGMFPDKPPPNWYGNLKELVGVQPGDPQLPGEGAGDG